jgi:hypothetical protein
VKLKVGILANTMTYILFDGLAVEGLYLQETNTRANTLANLIKESFQPSKMPF